MAIDPVCGMTVDEKTAVATSTYNSKTYYFCSRGCKVQFDKNPEKFLNAKPGEQGHGMMKH
jgi:YHS domain-containing protein